MKPTATILSCVLFGLTVIAIGGCAAKSTDSYNPKASTARQAIERSLDAWKSGKPFGTIAGSPAIDTYDARWQAGARLEEYSILEEVAEQEHPQFKVKLKLAGKPAETNEYLVVGIDPLLVFRKEDYRKATGM